MTYQKEEIINVAVYFIVTSGLIICYDLENYFGLNYAFRLALYQLLKIYKNRSRLLLFYCVNIVIYRTR